MERFYKEFEREFYMKIIVPIIPTVLVTSLLLSGFYSFKETKVKKELNFQQIGGLVTRIVLLFVYSESRSTSVVLYLEFNRLL